MTVRQLLQSQKYRTNVTVCYFSAHDGCEVKDKYHLLQYNELLYRHGNSIVRWFYIPHSSTPELVIEI